VSDLAKYHDHDKQVDIGILDFSTEFDVVSHRKHLSKLQHYGVRGKIDDLLPLERLATMWDMQFSPSTCYILSMKRDGDKSLHFCTLCGQVLQSVTDNPYLGVTLTDDLSFSTHVRKICAKGSCMLGFLNRNVKNCPQKLRELAYTSMCQSVLEYSSPVWDLYLQRDIENLEHIQRKEARFVLRTFISDEAVQACYDT